MIAPLDFLDKKGWTYKKINGEVLLNECPYCNKQKHLYMNIENGLFNCKRCFVSGGLSKLIKDFDTEFIYKAIYKEKIKYIEPIKQNIPDKNYLTEVRKIGKNILNDKNVIFAPFKAGFIYCDPNGKPYMTKWRETNKKNFYSEPKSEIFYPYAIECLDYEKDYLIITEGEIDCLSWKTYGFTNCIGIPGAGSFKGEWINLFKKFKTIYLCLDNDEAGKEGTNKIIQKLCDLYELKIINIPNKDINECLINNINCADITKYFENAETYKNQDLIHIVDIKIKNPSDEDYGFKTGFDDLDAFIKWRLSELTIMTAHVKTGKTTLMTNFIFEQARKERPVLIGSFEMTLEAMKKKIFSIMMQENYHECRNQAKLESFEKMIKHMPIYFINHYGAIKENKLNAAIRYAAKHCDIKFVMLDHLSYMHKYSANNMVYEIGEAMRKMKALTNELNIHIWLIAHPSKTQDESAISEFTLRGSSEIAQICDNLLIIRADKEKNQTQIELKFSRSELSQTGKIILDFDIRTQSYKKHENCKDKSKIIRNIFEEKETEDKKQEDLPCINQP